MLSWFRMNVERHGIIAATLLFVRSYGSRAVALAANAALPVRVECPCCGWKGRRFMTYVAFGSAGNPECPQCISHGRHRALFLWLRNGFGVTGKKGKVLIFAPEATLSETWRSAPGLTTIRTDIEPGRGIDVFSDIQKLPFADDSFDLIWCHHVLELVPDDISAIKEMNRVLKPNYGELVISSGMSAHRETQDFENPGEKQFGQWHFYGQDFPKRLEHCGFETKAIEYGLSDKDAMKFGIIKDEPAFLCRKQIN